MTTESAAPEMLHGWAIYLRAGAMIIVPPGQQPSVPLSDQHRVSHVPDGWGQSLRMTRPRVLGHPSGPTRSSRPSGALRCGDLPCQFKLTDQNVSLN